MSVKKTQPAAKTAKTKTAAAKTAAKTKTAKPAAAKVAAKAAAAAEPAAGRPKTLTKQDLALYISEKTGRSMVETGNIVQLSLERILDALASGMRVEFRDFGVFEVVMRNARLARNPRRPSETVGIPAHREVKFKQGKRMSELLWPGKPAPRRGAAKKPAAKKAGKKAGKAPAGKAGKKGAAE